MIRREIMGTFDYLTPSEAVDAAREDAPEFRRIVGLKGADAGRFMDNRTQAGYMRKPADPWRAHGHLDKFQEIKAVEFVTEDADPGTVEVFYAGGASEYLHRFDLLCVERPVRSWTVLVRPGYGSWDFEVLSPEGHGVTSWTTMQDGRSAEEAIKAELPHHGHYSPTGPVEEVAREGMTPVYGVPVRVTSAG